MALDHSCMGPSGLGTLSVTSPSLSGTRNHLVAPCMRGYSNSSSLPQAPSAKIFHGTLLIGPLLSLWGSVQLLDPTAPSGNCVGSLGLYIFFFLFRAEPAAYGSFQARGHIGAAAASLLHSHIQIGIRASSSTYTTAHGSA